MTSSAQRPRRTQKHTLAGLIFAPFVSLVFTVTAVTAAGTAQQMYLAAMAREQTVRVALLAADAPVSVAADVRAVVSDYQEIVRIHPASGYSDDALWQGGLLSIDAFVRFGQERDRNAGIRLLRSLATEYPTSRRVKEVPDQLARVDATVSAAPTADQTAKLATIKEIRREVLA